MCYNINDKKEEAYESMENCEEIVSAINHLGIGFAIFQDFEGKKGVFRAINNALSQKLGYSPDEIIDKKSFIEFLVPESLELVKARYEARIRGEDAPSHYEMYVTNKAGERVVLEAYIQRITYAGNPATMGFYIDITQKKILEEEMRINLETQKEFVTALNYTPEAIIITDSKGTVRYINPAFTTITGYTLGELIGKKVFILKSDEYPIEFYEEIRSTITSGKRWEGKLTGKRKDGSLYKASLVIAPVFDEKGRISTYIGVMRDITREEKFNEQMFHTQKMDAIGLLASGIAHDFNNILGGILGYVELLNVKTKDEEVKKILSSIEKAGDRAKKLIDKLLFFSRKNIKEKKSLDINLHVRNVIDILSRTMPKNVKIELDLDEKGSLIVRGDDTQIEQVIMNICINAFQAMEDKGGELIIKTTRFFPDDEFLTYHYGFKEREYVLLSISDTGCGMDEETKKRIFDPFFSTKKEGTGLGLSTAYAIVEGLEGKILVYSEKGEGTTFNIYLPSETYTSREENENLVEIKRGKGTILVIDDEKIIREMLKDVLETLGYEPLFARDGKDGIEKFEEFSEEIDLVIIDMNMPEYNGETVLKKIREKKPDIKAIFISGFGLNGMLKEITQEGIAEFLHKPFTLGELSEVLDKLLNN